MRIWEVPKPPCSEDARITVPRKTSGVSPMASHGGGGGAQLQARTGSDKSEKMKRTGVNTDVLRNNSPLPWLFIRYHAKPVSSREYPENRANCDLELGGITDVTHTQTTNCQRPPR